MRTLRLGYASGLVTGATKEEIESVPVYKYKSSSNNDEQLEEQEQGHGENSNDNGHDNISVSASSTTSTRTTTRKKRRSIFRWLYLLRAKQKSDDDPERNYDPITITPIEDAVCPICISEYEDDDLICKLWYVILIIFIISIKINRYEEKKEITTKLRCNILGVSIISIKNV